MWNDHKAKAQSVSSDKSERTRNSSHFRGSNHFLFGTFWTRPSNEVTCIQNGCWLSFRQKDNVWSQHENPEFLTIICCSLQVVVCLTCLPSNWTVQKKWCEWSIQSEQICAKAKQLSSGSNRDKWRKIPCSSPKCFVLGFFAFGLFPNAS